MYLDHNLYVGTSASELLHFVQIPPDPNDKFGRPVYILASRLSPYYPEVSGRSAGSLPGVQQIILLPRAGKACIRCNSTVTFYSLPELTPAYGNRKVKNCNWIGVDLDELGADDGRAGESPVQTILLSSNTHVQAIRLGEDPRVAHVCLSLPASVFGIDDHLTR